MRHLIGKYYHCIFDHDAGRHDLSKPHFHKIIYAEWYSAWHDARHGLKLYFSDISSPVYVGNGFEGLKYIYENPELLNL